jgi:GAF domain-containing protein
MLPDPVAGVDRDARRAGGAGRALPPIAPVWDGLGVASAAFVPLVVAGETVGVISFAFEAPRTLTPEERAFLLALGQQAALAVERARRFEAEHARPRARGWGWRSAATWRAAWPAT